MGLAGDGRRRPSGPGVFCNQFKRALPRSYRDATPELCQQLEAARAGTPTPGTQLAVRVVARRDELLGMIAALDRARQRHPDIQVAHPVIFVVTENLSTDGSTEPQVVTVAGWNPRHPALLPHVDALTFFSEENQERQTRGQADFANVLSSLSRHLELVETEPKVYLARPVDDPVKEGVRLSRMPLGFVIGTAEFM